MREVPPQPPFQIEAANDAATTDNSVLPLNAPYSELRRQIATLQAEHAALDTQLEALRQLATLNSAERDDLQIVRIKKRKLKIKDTILLLQLQIEPDELA